uniref:Uncharacterized protein n=1 Tax=Timema monikensis TaxID=170555 RepID=A0A7R9HV71_9NEOP|nr:unnamed protein product [Timema monikensis]
MERKQVLGILCTTFKLVQNNPKLTF